MPQVTVRGLLPLALPGLAMLILTGCSSLKAPSASGVCPALVPEVVALTPDELAATPASVKRKIAGINAAVLAACGDEP
jgi:hypothetical protein